MKLHTTVDTKSEKIMSESVGTTRSSSPNRADIREGIRTEGVCPQTIRSESQLTPPPLKGWGCNKTQEELSMQGKRLIPQSQDRNDLP